MPGNSPGKLQFSAGMDSMESLSEIKKMFLQFVDILKEGLLSKSEFENAKRKLLRVFADTETLKALTDISHVLSEDKQKEIQKTLLAGAVANAVSSKDLEEPSQQQLQKITLLEPGLESAQIR